MKIKYSKIIPILAIVILLTGCWDRTEIERKSFISTIGIDAGVDAGKQLELKKIGEDEPFREYGNDKLHLTFASPDMSELGPGKSPAVKDTTIVVDAYSMQDAIYKANSKSSKSLKYEHSKLLLISDEILLQPEIMKEVVDYLQRESSMNRNMYMAVVQGKAESFVKYNPSVEKNIGTYFEGLMENSELNATILPVTLNKFLSYLNENGNALIPRMIFDKKDNNVRVCGVTIIKNYKQIGSFSPMGTADLEIIRGKIRGGKKVIYKDGHPIDFKIEGIKRKIKFNNVNGKYTFDLNIDLEGSVKGYYVGKSIYSKEEITKLEEDFNKALSAECSTIAKSTQNDIDVDCIGLNDYLAKYRPSIWKEVADKWENIYKSVDINVNIKTKLRRVGVVK